MYKRQAWGDRAPSGLAVLDDTGALVHLSRASTDDSIAEALVGYLTGDCIVGIDAPLIVTNPTGSRPCEAALSHDFARFDAGTHPSNTGKPEFSDSPRGARLAARLGLDIDPASTAARRAIEVYPHAALVAVFGLGRTLKYKQKPGRSLETLRSDLLLLTQLLEGLATAECPLHLGDHDGWRALVPVEELFEFVVDSSHAGVRKPDPRIFALAPVTDQQKRGQAGQFPKNQQLNQVF